MAETPRQSGRFDLAGALTSTAGVASLVYGFVRVATDGWGDRLALGVFYFLSQFIQRVIGLSPLRAGLAFLPMTGALFVMSRTAPRLMPRLGAKPLMIVGMLPAITSLAWLSRVSPATGYWSGVFGPMMLLGIGMGLVFVPLTTTSLAGVAPSDSGAASSMVNVMQQVGGALGLAVLVAVYGTASRDASRHPLPGLTAAAQGRYVLAHGMASAFGLSAILSACSLLLIITLIRTRRLVPQPSVVREEEPAGAPQ